MTDRDVIKYGDTFYLQHQSGNYLVGVDRGRYNWPKLGNTGKVKLQIVGGKGEVTSNSYIKIKTTESVTGNNHILGAFTDSHDCYYWQDGYDDNKQGWRIIKVSGQGPICYGDRVHIINVSYRQFLVADTRHQGYVTTDTNANQWWVIESTKTRKIGRAEDLQPEEVFPLSVASGDPTTSGVILWTRVNPDVYDEKIALKYEVSSDESFSSVVLKGDVPRSNFSPDRDYTARVDLDDSKEEPKLKPNQTYYYRFGYKDVKSRTGRCRTLPLADEEIKRLRLAVLTCNDYSTGYFNAFYHLAKEDVDFVIHLGDFAYEYPQYPEGYGEIYRTDLELEDNDFPPKDAKAGIRATSLRDFRRIYQKYREDRALQSAMERHTWMIMLDDHEIADDAYWDYQNKTMGAHPDHGIYAKYSRGTPEANKAMLDLYNHAMQAWTEYVPARWGKITEANASEGEDPEEIKNRKELYKLRGEHYKLYRNFRFGNLVELFLSDSRTYRDEAEGEYGVLYNPLTWRNTSKNNVMLEEVKDAKAANPEADVVSLMKEARKKAYGGKTPPDWKWSMLGKVQKEWLIGDDSQKSNEDDEKSNEDRQKSNAAWKVWGNQTLLATSAAVEMQAHDDWHGFKAERYEILQRIKESETKRQGTNEASRFVVFTGDMHTSLIAYLKTDFEEDLDPFEGQWSWNPLDLANNTMNRNYNKLVGVEFMTPAVTSPGISEGIYAALEAWMKEKSGSLDSLLGAGVLGTTAAAVSSVVNTATSVGSSLFGTLKDVASAVTPDVVEDAVGSVMPQMSLHKHVTGNLIKSLSPHLEHFDSEINGYAIAEFTLDELTWSVYHIGKTKPDNTGGEKELIQSVKYDPESINLHDWYAKLA